MNMRCPTCWCELKHTKVGYICRYCGWEHVSNTGVPLEEVLEDEYAYGGEE